MNIYRNFFIKILGLFIISFSLISFTSAKDLTSTNFIIRDPVIGTGGGYGTSSSFKLISGGETLFTDANSSTSYIGHYGFLYYVGGIIIPPVVVPSSGGGGGADEAIPPFIQDPNCKARVADFNCDDRVDIKDLSILLYFINKSGSVITYYDLSEDGLLDIRDISIMFYYWDI